MQEISRLGDIESDFPYQDILFLEHPNLRRHPRQSNALRAGQFSPFAALSGFDGQLEEVSRYTSKKIFLTDSEKEQLDVMLTTIQHSKQLQIQVTYFEQDLKKQGGSYQNKIGYLYRVDSIHHLIVFQDKSKIRMQDIVKIEIINSPD